MKASHTMKLAYGGKAAGLAAAVRAGLPVPAGFAIAADALADLCAGRAAQGLRAELGEMLAELPGALAVRSSAVGEDTAAASFAAQHTTVLARAEDALGPGQDVEWALAHDQLHLLQSRPTGTPERPHADTNKSTGIDPQVRIPSSPID